MTRQIRRLLSDRDGATAIEYGLIGGLLTIAIVAGFGGMSSQLTNIFYAAKNALVTR